MHICAELYKSPHVANSPWKSDGRELCHTMFICNIFIIDFIQKKSLELHNSALRWENDQEQPKSICSEPCPIGHVHNHQDQCCWSCVKCREEFEYVKNDTCISCQPGWAPNERKNGCTKLKAEVIDWWSPWAYVPLIFATIGILATSFTICVFIK